MAEEDVSKCINIISDESAIITSQGWTEVPPILPSPPEVDPISSNSVSELEDGQLLESSSDASDSFRINKRPSSHCHDGTAAKKIKKKISFSAVTAYYFPRAQGFTCVPSQGGSTLGMALKHSHEESYTLSEHANQQRRNHRRLLMQLRKKRKCRVAPKEEEEVAAGPSAAEEVKESESDDSDADGQQMSDMSDSELDVDNYYFLQPVPTRQRRALLRESGIGKIETSEKDDCRQIRVSRESCGCSCQVYCEPETCSCAQSGIQCQVDRLNFPCGCSRDACANPSGRVEFNPVRVRTHFIHTLMRLELENAQESGTKNLPHRPAIEEQLPVVDGPSLVPPDPHYNWDMQMAPVQYAPIADPLAENSWFSHYVEPSNTYSLYSGATNPVAEVFSYDPPAASYEMYHPPTVEQHYTELGENQPFIGPSEYYSEYSQTYQPFDPHGFTYHAPVDTYTNEVYNYVENSSTFENSEAKVPEPQRPKAESSNSSSEEDGLDIGSSLATIVKETMVSV